MKTQEIPRKWRLLILLFVSLPAAALPQTVEYRVRRIEPASANGALNDSSVIVGVGSRGPFLWKDGVVTILAQPYGCLEYLLFDLNNQGVAAGYGTNCSSLLVEALRWTATSCFNIGGLVSNQMSSAYGINSSGKITGGILLPDDNSFVFIYDGSLNFLPIRGSGFSINDSDYVVGQYIYEVNGESANGGFLYRNGSMSQLPGFGGACGINNRNQVIGIEEMTTSSGRGPVGTGLLWDNGNVTILGTKVGPYSINDSGTVVGVAQVGGSQFKAWRWKDGMAAHLNDLIPPNSGIDLLLACDINNKGEILCQGRESGSRYYYLLTPEMPTLTRPRSGEVWISGGSDTVRWDSIARDRKLLLELSTDGGQTFQVTAADIPADSGKYVWDIPKEILSTKCILMVRDNSTLDSLARSEPFTLKPYVLTRKEATTGDLIAYDIARDRWGFWNFEEDVWPYLYWYTRFAYSPGIDPFTGGPYPTWTGDTSFANAEDADFPDWPSFVRAFTPDACYISLPLAVYSQRAVARWAGVRDAWGGSCFGIAGTNALAFAKRESFVNKYPHFAYITLVGDPVAVHSDTGVVSTVTEIFTHQYGVQSRYNDLLGREKTSNQTLRDLKEMLRQAETPVRTLTIGSDNKLKDPGFHTIVAYKIERAAEDSPVWNVHVYDNSVPGDPDPIIEIDTSQNCGDGLWTPTYAWPLWGGRKLMWLEIPSESYLSPPTLSKRGAHQSPFGLPPGMVEVNSTRDASIRIRDASGNVTGYGGVLPGSEIPGSIPLFAKNGALGPPYGYMLASGNYAIMIDSFQTGESRVFFFTENRTMGYRRTGADAGQRDHLRFDTTGAPTLSVANPDPVTKSIMLKTILSEPALEKVYTVHSLGLGPNDSLAMTNTGDNALKLASYGLAKDYDLRVEHASTNGLKVFTRRNIVLSANSTHTLLPDWSTLGDGPLMILVDLGNDGSEDDTLRLTNEATDVQSHGSLIPGEYRLEQNYPNPFNPVTTIRYGLPQKSVVRLTVYNLLGQEVATLVQGEQEVGYHEARFDGSGLASGVYLYRLQARSLRPAEGETGDFVQSRKLLLLR